MNRTSRSLVAVLAAVLLGGGIALTTAAPASAHDELLSSYPEAESTITGSPAEITLSFSGELLADMQSAVIEVIAPDGQNIATDAPAVDGTSITQQLTPTPPDGVFTVRWKVVSSDGHPISGEYTYTVTPLDPDPATPTPAATAAEQTPEPSPTPTDTTAAAGRGEPTETGALLPTLAVVTGVVVIGGALVVVLMVARERRRRDRAESSDGAGGTDES